MRIVTAGLQLLFYLILYYPVCFFFRGRFRYVAGDTVFKKGVVLIPNHQSRLDIFLVYAAIPFRRFIRLIPIYSLVTYKYMDTWWKYSILRILGCYCVMADTKKASGVLLQVLDLIDSKETLLIFPEGKVVKQHEKPQIRPGVSYIAQKRNVYLVPMFLSGFRNVTLKHLFLRKYSAQITVGKAKTYVTKDRYVRDISATILESIYSLRSQ